MEDAQDLDGAPSYAIDDNVWLDNQAPELSESLWIETLAGIGKAEQATAPVVDLADHAVSHRRSILE
jgi:hypothetical protein